MALVDPFIPQTRQPQARPDRSRFAASGARRPDVPRTDYSAPLRRAAVAARPAAAAFPRIMKKTFTPPPRTRGGRFKAALQYSIILVWAVVMGLGANSVAVGEAAIGSYALVALFMRFSSQLSFMLALLAFACIVVLEVVMPQGTMSSNFAVYAFLLLLIGAIQLGLEIRQQARWQKRRRN
jgi:hypothetical protein